MEMEDSANGRPISPEAAEKVFMTILKNEPISRREIAEKTGISANSLMHILPELERGGLIRKVGKPNSPKLKWETSDEFFKDNPIDKSVLELDKVAMFIKTKGGNITELLTPQCKKFKSIFFNELWREQVREIELLLTPECKKLSPIFFNNLRKTGLGEVVKDGKLAGYIALLLTVWCKKLNLYFSMVYEAGSLDFEKTGYIYIHIYFTLIIRLLLYKYFVFIYTHFEKIDAGSFIGFYFGGEIIRLKIDLPFNELKKSPPLKEGSNSSAADKTKEMVAAKRAKRKRPKFTVEAEEVFAFWNKQSNLTTHKRGTKVYERSIRKLRYLLSGEWARRFTFYNSTKEKTELLAATKKKFTVDEIKNVIAQYNKVVGAIRDKGMVAKSLDRFIYNEDSGGSWFFKVYFEGVEEPDVGYLKKVFGDRDFGSVYGFISKAFQQAGRQDDVAVLQIIKALVPIRTELGKRKRGLAGKIKVLGLTEEQENALLSALDSAFSFSSVFSTVWNTMLMKRAGGDLAKFGADLSVWTIRDFERDFYKEIDNRYSLMIKNIDGVLYGSEY